MTKGYALLEVLVSTIVIFLSINLIFLAITKNPERITEIPANPWEKIGEGCDYICAIIEDLP
jgi:hypothetical protein